MLRVRIAAFRGRPLSSDPCVNIQRMEVNGGGYYQHPHLSRQRQHGIDTV